MTRGERSRRLGLLVTLVVVALDPARAEPAPAAAPIEAVTPGGDRVRLFPTGRWEFVDAKKAEAQKPVVAAFEQAHDREVASEQGGLFGIGRKVRPGDKDYNRGSLGGK